MTHIPLKVKDSERIVRIAFFPRHYKKNDPSRPVQALIRSPSGKDEVSVIRHEYKGANFCKAKALEIQVAPHAYKGLSVSFVNSLKAHGSDVIDSRRHFYGHADIIHNFIPEKGKPLPPEMILRLDAILQHFQYYEDSAPSEPNWKGPLPLLPPYSKADRYRILFIRLRTWIKTVVNKILPTHFDL